MNQFIILKNKYYSLYVIFLFSGLLNYYIISISIGNYPQVKKLNNGDYIVISSTSIIFLDTTLTLEYTSKTINFENPIFTNDSSTFSTTISQFSNEDGNFIIALIKNNLYFFSSEGTLIKIVENISFINQEEIYSIIPLGHSENEHYFSIIYINRCSTHDLYFIKGIYNSNLNEITFSEPHIFTDITSHTVESLSCQLMKYNDNIIINCIYGNNDNLICKNFNPNNNFKILENSPSYTDFIYSGCKYFNSIVLPGNDKIILCSFSSSSYIHCYKYDILTNMIIKSVKIDIELTPISHKNFFVEYFYETDEILIGSTDYSSNIFISQCSVELQCSDIQKIILTENNLIFNGANIIIPFDKNNYYIMAYYEGSSLTEYLFNLNLNISPINPLNCSNYYNYEQTECIDSIPEGYYCNNTLLKTIDKCHENCKTCKKGPTSINNNCLSCPSSGKKYYDLGNCTDDCVYGYFNMITDKVCKCSSNIKCYYCTEYSIQYDLCEVCNNDAGFYQKIDDERRSDKFINCYSNIEYYYYLQNKKYYPCYSTCKTCNENGTNIENNCTSCRDGYEFKNDFENDKNCYEICINYYYYDSDNKYHCIDICPQYYSAH